MKKNEAAKQNENKSEVRTTTLAKTANDSGDTNIADQQPPQPKKEEVKDKSKPVSSTPITGTPWLVLKFRMNFVFNHCIFFRQIRCVVWTGDNRVFFYNPSSKTSLWDCPPELKNRPEIAELTKNPPTKDKDKELSLSSSSSQNTIVTGNKRSLDEQSNGHHSQPKEEESNKKSR